MKFIFIADETNYTQYDMSNTYKFECETYDDVLFHFENFMRGCGFMFHGHIEMVKESNHEDAQFQSSEERQPMDCNDSWKWTIDELNFLSSYRE